MFVITADPSASLGSPAQRREVLALEQGQPPQLLLYVKDRIFVVATECNGFGLLTSALIMATILVFQYRLPWVEKLSLWAMSVPIAISFNFLRIVSICALARSARPAVSGWRSRACWPPSRA